MKIAYAIYANSRDVGYGGNFHSYVTYFHAKGWAVETSTYTLLVGN